MDKIYFCIKKCLDIKNKEKVLIITDKKMKKISELFLHSSRKFTENAEIAVIEPTGRDGVEPPKGVASKMLEADVIIMPTSSSLSHTKARRKASKKGARIVSLPCFDENMLDALTADTDKMKAVGYNLKKIFNKCSRVHIESPSGANMFLDIGSEMFIDDGITTERGSFSNLPAGEVFVMPANANGILVIDSFKNIITGPTRAVIEDNKLLSIEGEQGQNFMNMLKDEKYREVAEFGIGINPKAKITGKLLMDEKCLGTCHIAFGNNASFGGKNDVPVHFDTIIFNPTIKLDKKVIMNKGKPVW